MPEGDEPRRVLRFEVPVDDEWHTLYFLGDVVNVDTRRPDVVELWVNGWPTDAVDKLASYVHHFRVYGTGQPLPLRVHHVGTAIVPGGALVWHLFEQVP